MKASRILAITNVHGAFCVFLNAMLFSSAGRIICNIANLPDHTYSVKWKAPEVRKEIASLRTLGNVGD
jgi:hypothetical protein